LKTCPVLHLPTRFMHMFAAPSAALTTQLYLLELAKIFLRQPPLTFLLKDFAPTLVAPISRVFLAKPMWQWGW